MEQNDNQRPSAKPWYRRKIAKIIGSVLLILLLPLLLVTFVPIPKDSALPQVNADATTIEAKNQFDSHHSMSTTNHAFMLLKHVAVINCSDHPLMIGVAKELTNRLAAYPGLDAVDGIDATQQEKWLDDGAALPDLFVVMDMPQFTESGLLATGRDIKATVQINFSQSVGESAHHVTDGYTLPACNIEGQMTLNHQSTSTGYESANAQYQCVIKNMTDQIFEQLTGNFEKWSSEYPQRADIPKVLYPAYRALPDDLPLPDHPSLKQLFSGRQLMRHNITAWTFRVVDGEASNSLFETYAQQLKDAGWQVDTHSKRTERMSNNHLRAKRDADVLEIFEDRHNEPIDASKPIDIVLRYADRFNRSDMNDAMLALQNEESLPLQTWLTFERLMDRKTRDQFVKRYLDTPKLDPDIQLMVIDYLARHKQKDEALKRLESFAPVALAIDRKHESEVERLGKKLTGNKKYKAPKLTTQACEQAGLLQLQDDQPLTYQCQLGESVMCYTVLEPSDNQPDELALIRTIIEKASTPQGVFKHSLQIIGSEHGNSSSSSTEHQPRRPWTSTLNNGNMGMSWIAQARELENGQFEVKVSSHKPRKKEPKTVVQQ